MRLKLTLVSGQQVDDVLVTIDATATVNQLAERLRVSHPRAQLPATPGETLTLRVDPHSPRSSTLAPSMTLGDAGLRSGAAVGLTNAAGEARSTATAAATLRVLSGPDAGKSFAVPRGTTVIGRDRGVDIRLNDPMVSNRHARL